MDSKLHDILREYSFYPLKRIDYRFENIFSHDKIIIKSVFNNIFDSANLSNIVHSNKKFYESLRHNSNKIKSMDVTVKSSPNEDEIITINKFIYNNKYMTNLNNFNYINKPNTISLKLNAVFYNFFNKQINKDLNNNNNFSKLNNLTNKDQNNNKSNKYLNNNSLLLNEMSIGVDYKYKSNKKKIYIENSSKFNNNLELIAKLSTYTKNTSKNRKQLNINNKLYLTKNFNNVCFLFNDFPQLNCKNNISLILSNKINNNYVDNNNNNNIDDINNSNTVFTDSIKSIGIEYNRSSFDSNVFQKIKRNYLKNLNIDLNNYGKFFIDNESETEATHNLKRANFENTNIDFFNLNTISLKNTNVISNFKASIKYKNSLNSQYFKIKTFYRKFLFITDSLLLQTMIEFNKLIPTVNTKCFKSNEVLIVNDFKGVDNPGYKLADGDLNGFLNYVKFYNKIYMTDISVVNNGVTHPKNYQIIPYVHLNILTTYNRNGLNKLHIDSIENNNYSNNNIISNLIYNSYLSCGFGISYMSDLISIEGYYNPLIRKNDYNYGSSFGFNIGID